MTSSIEQATAAIESERKVTIQQAGEEAAKRLAELVDRVNDHTAAQRSGLLGDAEAASRRLLNRMATLTILVITAGAIVVACVVLAYRRVTARLGK